MSNSLYEVARIAMLNAGTQWTTETISVSLAGTGYVIDLVNHDFYDHVSAEVISGAVALGSKTTTGGAARAANSTFSTVTGATIKWIIIYQAESTAATSPLIAAIDTATGLPIVPNGGDIVISWDTGTNGIFRP